MNQARSRLLYIALLVTLLAGMMFCQSANPGYANAQEHSKQTQFAGQDANNGGNPAKITVANDNSYAPTVFTDADGQPRGISIDLWKLWSKKTGVLVEFRLMEWDAALASVREGKADVVGGLFHTPQREAYFDFTSAYDTVTTSIFFHKDLLGIKEVSDLTGFRVGVVKGDSIAEFIQQRYPRIELKTYPGAEDLIKAAISGEIKAFVSDSYVARFYLAKHDSRNTYREATAPIAENKLLAAVRKGDKELLALVQHGFDMISEQEKQDIVESWTGIPLSRRIPWGGLLAAGATIAAVIGLMSFWNLQLKRKVAQATRDIQQRNEEIERNEREIATLFMAAQVGIAYVKDRVFLKVNDAMCTIFGYTQEELLGQSSRILYFSEAEFAQVAHGAYQQALTNDVAITELHMRHKDGRAIDVLLRLAPLVHGGSAAGFACTFLDLTAKKKAEEHLSRLALAIEHAAEEFIITDTKGVIEYVNPAFEKISGYSRAEAIGKTPAILKSGKHDSAFYANLWHTIRDGHVWQGQFTNRNKAGALFVEEATISPVYTSKGESMGYVAIKRDITAQLRMEADLRQSQKMDSIGTLAGGIAHDFNNILSAIVGYTDLALMQVAEGEPLRNDLLEVRHAADRATALVRQILTFSRNQPQEKLPLQVSLVVKEALKLLRASIPSTIEIRQDITAQGAVLADPTQIHQVMMNLCTNAYHAMMERGGVLAVALKEITLDQAMVDSGIELPPGQYLKLSVSDSGCGIDKDIQARIFEPYFTTKEKGRGTGLGLAMVHGIVKEHQGRIAVYSEPGQGSTFNVYLPMINQEQSTASQVESLPPMSKAHERIMVVDDDAAIRDSVSQFLTQAGYRADLFGNGVEAWAALQQTPDAWHLLLTDQTMPGMTGDQLAAKVRELRPGLPVIISSGFSEILDESRVHDLGVKAYLQKPVGFSPLLTAVAKALYGEERC